MALPSQKDTKLWLVLLYEIDGAGGSCAPAELYSGLKEYFPSITDADLSRTRTQGGSTWENTVQWARMHLVNQGFIDNSHRGIWAITPDGRAWLNQHWRGPNAEYSNVDRPAPITPDKLMRPIVDKSRRRLVSARITTAPDHKGIMRGDLLEGTAQKDPSTRSAIPATDSTANVARIVARAAAGPAAIRFSPTEKYLLSTLAYEMGQYSEALSLADTSLAEGLSDQYRSKAERLRDLCSIKMRIGR